jgi:hypothetical protein
MDPMSSVSASTTSVTQVDSKTQMYIARMSKTRSIKNPFERAGALRVVLRDLNKEINRVFNKKNEKFIILSKTLDIIMDNKGLDRTGKFEYRDARVSFIENIINKFYGAGLDNNSIIKLYDKVFNIVRDLGVYEAVKVNRAGAEPIVKSEDKKLFESIMALREKKPEYKETTTVIRYADDKFLALDDVICSMINRPQLSKSTLRELFAEAVETAKTFDGFQTTAITYDSHIAYLSAGIVRMVNCEDLLIADICRQMKTA